MYKESLYETSDGEESVLYRSKWNLKLSKMIKQNYAANYMHICISCNKILSKLYNMNHNIYTRLSSVLSVQLVI